VKPSRSSIHRKFHTLPDIRFEDQALTSFSGLIVFQALFAKLDFKERLQACFRHLDVSPIFGHHTVMLLLVVHLLLGYRRLRELRFYEDDPMVGRLLGLSRLPDIATVSRALSSADAQSADKTRSLFRTLVLDRLRLASFWRITLDFDGSVQSTRRAAEGTAVGFNKKRKGDRSYYPLFCTVAQTGQALALVVGTGRATLFGAAAAALAEVQAPSPFQRDLHAFGLLIARLTIALVLVVLTAHVLFGRPVLESLLFSVALAVGLTPELLPMITTVTLSRGALRMAARKVIVKRLVSIHDLGAMDVLCTDKTGTLTAAEITLAQSLDALGKHDDRPALLGAISADLGGDRGALDTALIAGAAGAAKGWTLLARHCFDFNRRLGSVLADGPEGKLLIAKGAPESILPLCASMRTISGTAPMGPAEHAAALTSVRALAEQGLRSVAIASRPWSSEIHDLDANDECELIYEGLCAFADPPKVTCSGAIARLAAAGVRVKILSGDDPVVVKRLAGLVGLHFETVLSGSDIAKLSDDALTVQVETVDAYGRLAPDQKSRLIKALQSKGHVVGFLGDGINDAPALKVADIGLSVDGATGVAQAAADMILLAPDLEVVADGVEEGRRTFANILKYVRMGASSNFGNMLSMAVASLFLPFLPMLPTQILLNNLLYDFSEIGIPFDTVRPEVEPCGTANQAAAMVLRVVYS